MEDSTMGERTRQILPRFIMGLAAAGLSLFFLFAERGDMPILLASSFFLMICLTDTLYAKIPNLLNLALVLAGVGFNVWATGLPGLLFSLGGLALGLGLLLPFYLMGGMGAGDVKALAALGALIGPSDIFQVFLLMAMFGGLMAIVHYALAHNLRKKCAAGWLTLRTFFITRDIESLKPDRSSEKLRFPYAAAIAFGFFAFVHWGGFF
ncbi:prepilin peptidase [Desulfuromonas sp.]|uniref:prepilin peptidase n=2 Tax=Desulfuromonas TaxID=890 RepID=UPI0025BC03A6|nr:prepilin peptidase [Desulfuromonas sp.]